MIPGLDFALTNHGSICILQPLTQAAVEWVDEHLDGEETQRWGQSGVVIEPRYVADILAGIDGDGLTYVTTGHLIH